MLTQICCLFLDSPTPSTIFIHPFPPPKTLNAQIQEDWRAKIAKMRKRLNFWSLCTYMKISGIKKKIHDSFFVSYCRQLSVDIKMKIVRLKPVLLALAFVAEYWTNTTCMIFSLILRGKYLKYDAIRDISVWLQNRLIFARLEPWDWQNFLKSLF